MNELHWIPHKHGTNCAILEAKVKFALHVHMQNEPHPECIERPAWRLVRVPSPVPGARLSSPPPLKQSRGRVPGHQRCGPLEARADLHPGRWLLQPNAAVVSLPTGRNTGHGTCGSGFGLQTYRPRYAQRCSRLGSRPEGIMPADRNSKPALHPWC